MNFLHLSHMVPSLSLALFCTLDEVTNPMINLLSNFDKMKHNWFFFCRRGGGGRRRGADNGREVEKEEDQNTLWFKFGTDTQARILHFWNCYWWKKNGEGDHATAGGETQTTPSSREVFPGISLNACPETEGTGGTLSVAYVQKWND